MANAQKNQTHCKHGHRFTPENTYVERKTGFRICLTCRKKYRDGWAKRNTTRRAQTWRRWNLKAKFGITPEQVDAMLAEQGGGCAICGSKVSKTKISDRFHIDHDHKTNRVRGLLCNHCNVAIGMANDDP